MDKETVDRVRKEAEGAYEVYIKTKVAYDEASEVYLKLNRRFQSFDMELALTDGRLKVYKTAQPKEVKPATLSLGQLQAIAEALGIKLDPSQEDNESIDKAAKEVTETKVSAETTTNQVDNDLLNGYDNEGEE